MVNENISTLTDEELYEFIDCAESFVNKKWENTLYDSYIEIGKSIDRAEKCPMKIETVSLFNTVIAEEYFRGCSEEEMEQKEEQWITNYLDTLIVKANKQLGNGLDCNYYMINDQEIHDYNVAVESENYEQWAKLPGHKHHIYSKDYLSRYNKNSEIVMVNMKSDGWDCKFDEVSGNIYCRKTLGK